MTITSSLELAWKGSKQSCLKQLFWRLLTRWTIYGLSASTFCSNWALWWWKFHLKSFQDPSKLTKWTTGQGRLTWVLKQEVVEVCCDLQPLGLQLAYSLHGPEASATSVDPVTVGPGEALASLVLDAIFGDVQFLNVICIPGLLDPSICSLVQRSTRGEKRLFRKPICDVTQDLSSCSDTVYAWLTKKM